MNIKEIRCAIMITLGGTLIGTLLFIFGLSLNNLFFITIQYIIALLLYICSFLAAYRQYQKNHSYIFIYIVLLIIIITIITTYAFIMKCL